MGIKVPLLIPAVSQSSFYCYALNGFFLQHISEGLTDKHFRYPCPVILPLRFHLLLLSAHRSAIKTCKYIKMNHNASLLIIAYPP